MLFLTLGMMISWGLAVIWWLAYLTQTVRLHKALRDLARLRK
jgi:hypothetical protein